MNKNKRNPTISSTHNFWNCQISHSLPHSHILYPIATLTLRQWPRDTTKHNTECPHLYITYYSEIKRTKITSPTQDTKGTVKQAPPCPATRHMHRYSKPIPTLYLYCGSDYICRCNALCYNPRDFLFKHSWNPHTHTHTLRNTRMCRPCSIPIILKITPNQYK